MFEITKTFISLEILHRELNQTNSIYFLKKFHDFINDVFRVVITLKNRNVWYLFSLKDKSDYESSDINKGYFSCGTRYIGETKRKAEVKWNWHINPSKNSEPLKYLGNNLDHCTRPWNLRGITYCSLETWS